MKKCIATVGKESLVAQNVEKNVINFCKKVIPKKIPLLIRQKMEAVDVDLEVVFVDKAKNWIEKQKMKYCDKKYLQNLLKDSYKSLKNAIKSFLPCCFK